VESNSLRNISDPDITADTDIEVEMTPFVNPKDLVPDAVGNGGDTGRVIEGQAEVFIGRKFDAQTWDWKEADAREGIELNVLSEFQFLLFTFFILLYLQWIFASSNLQRSL
jgi:hypothetical protein